ncbi:MAG: metallophosphoesterase [Sphingomonadales bacterium]|nr:metallophosphoesterase [Sphingomonadales bacterium]
MPQPVTLFHVSDLHFGAEDREALDWFADEVARERPDGIVCTGDITMRARHREFAAATHWLAALAAPVMVLPGNHDMPYFNLVERFTRPYARYRRLHASNHRDLALHGVAVIGLKTIARAQWRLNWSKGRVSSVDLGATLDALGAASAPMRLVACHHPLTGANGAAGGSTHGGTAALAALAAAGADAVLSGHVHDPFDLVVDAGGRPIRLIGAGTLSERVRATPPSYNRLVYDGGLHVEHRLASPR